MPTEKKVRYNSSAPQTAGEVSVLTGPGGDLTLPDTAIAEIISGQATFVAYADDAVASAVVDAVLVNVERGHYNHLTQGA